MRLAIFTHVLHSKRDGYYCAYPPYLREMNIWLKHVDEVEVVAPLHPKEEILLEDSYQHSHITFTKISSFDLLNITSSLKAIFRIPLIIYKILVAMKRAAHLHLRCPGNIGLLACICQIFFPRKQKTAKYAGNWDPEAKQPWTYRFQKWILSNTLLTRNMTVLVYGEWPDQSKNVLSFFTASFSESEKAKIEKDFSPPYKFMFVGNLVLGKQPLFAVELVQALKAKNINAELHVYGEGEKMYAIKKQTGNKDYIHLHGNQPLDVVKLAYKESHFLILASKSEGWPKAVAEAMFFGCIPIVTPISCVPWMLNYGSRGILIPEVKVDSGEWREDSRDVLKVEDSGRNNVVGGGVLAETVERIIELIKQPEEMRGMSLEAQEWSQDYTLEKFEAAIKELLAPKALYPETSPPAGLQVQGDGERIKER